MVEPLTFARFAEWKMDAIKNIQKQIVKFVNAVLETRC